MAYQEERLASIKRQLSKQAIELAMQGRWQEAVEAAKVINPKLAIPMHYGAIVGSRSDAEKFKENAPCKVEII